MTSDLDVVFTLLLNYGEHTLAHYLFFTIVEDNTAIYNKYRKAETRAEEC